MPSQAQAPPVQRPECRVSVVPSGGRERRGGWRAGGWPGGPGLPPAVSLLPLLAGAVPGFRPQGAREGALPAPLPLCPSVPLSSSSAPGVAATTVFTQPPEEQRTVPLRDNCRHPPSWESPSWCLRLITLGRPPGEAGREGARPPSVQAFPHGFPFKVTVLRVFCSTVGVGWALPPSQPRLQVRRSRAGPLGPSRRPETVPTATCSQRHSPLAELTGGASLGGRRPAPAACWAPGVQVRAGGGPVGPAQEACRARSRGAGSDVSCALEGLLVLAGERAWEGYPPSKQEAESQGRWGSKRGRLDTGIWQRDRNDALLGPACWQEGRRQACLGCANCDTQAVAGVAHLGLSSPRPAG